MLSQMKIRVSIIRDTGLISDSAPAGKTLTARLCQLLSQDLLLDYKLLGMQMRLP